MRVIGNKDDFAIEYEKTHENKYLMGRLILWINGFQIGTLDDEQMLSATNHQLKKLKSEEINISQIPINKNELLKIIKNDDRFLLNLGDTFDDFWILVCSVEDCITIFWELEENSFFEYPGYPKNMMSYTTSRESIKDVINQLEQELH
ncbi:hypothetical protein BFW38_05220 [Terasakiispira papahanaumokuakeensis]|uniref:Uncharacterized protein n=1 Tax=Terasakiispira papahanaumokuakeensis TaxID=197479 RepID=A0A1E2V865_9GAMM|nr:Imm42 family immunity protein [Terasakiispira papahanaumokuakeensis]ODC03036.1 hypothetical protein BFW38_05220 [Terasakiispira papahanaumokuakeensis]